MIIHKSCHKCGLDTIVYNKVKNTKCQKDYYLYIYDYCSTKITDLSNFYTNKNNETNTWNYNLHYENTTKESIMKTSKLFNFGDYSYNEQDTKILVKANGHIYSSDTYGQSHIVEKDKYENTYNKEKYIGQKILRTTENKNEELNVYIVRDLNSRQLYFYCVLCINNTNININRKKSKVEFKNVDISILGDRLKDFIEYLNYIKIDYGRVELLLDKNIGWCVIDINNSPGGGPLTNSVYKKISDIFMDIIK